MGYLLYLLLLSIGHCPIIAQPPPSTTAENDVYRRCFNLDVNKPACVKTVDVVANPTDECYTVATQRRISIRPKDDNHLPFACHEAPCSVLNEAWWLGNYPMEEEGHFLVHPSTHGEEPYDPDKPETIRKRYVSAVNGYWKMFKRMLDDDGLQLPENVVERLSPPDYIVERLSSAFPDLKNQKIVPTICDPRSFLVCEHSIRLGHEWAVKNPGVGVDRENPTPLGRCRCHPLYAEEGIEEIRGLKVSAKKVNVCYGKALVPCDFGRTLPPLGYHILNDSARRDDVSPVNPTWWGDPTVHDASLDREAPYLEPEDFFDFFKHDGTVSVFWPKTSRCMSTMKCEYFGSVKEMLDFRKGLIWQGFGIHPIVREMMLMTATKLCKCKFREGYKENRMHECIKERHEG